LFIATDISSMVMKLCSCRLKDNSCPTLVYVEKQSTNKFWLVWRMIRHVLKEFHYKLLLLSFLTHVKLYIEDSPTISHDNLVSNEHQHTLDLHPKRKNKKVENQIRKGIK
jgi:hypothetical protein